MSDSIKATFPNLDDVTRRLRAVGAASQSVFMQAAEAGGRVVQRAAIANAPGPHIGINVEAESGTRAVASVGPLKSKLAFFYRYFEFGTKAHKAKGTAEDRAFKKYLRKIGRQDLVNTEPHMTMRSGGLWKTPKKVSGVTAKPFLRPAMERTNEIVEAVGNVYLAAIKEKTG